MSSNSLTAFQTEAIESRSGNLQIVACAGSGKTEVIARRLAGLLASEEASPRNIIAFTFTEKAAAELKDRIHARVAQIAPNVIGLAEMFVGTIHGFCLELLKSEIPKYLKFEVLNDVQQTLFVNRNSRASGLTETTDLAGQALKRYRDTGRYVSCLNILRESDVDLSVLEGSSIAAGLARYENLIDSRGYLDYSSILKIAVDALEVDENLRSRLRERIKYVVVDEYQDVNPIQERLVRALHALGAEICVVGDDDQTIYQWRGGEVRNILTFAERYAPVEQVRLEENFRSSPAIVEIARTFIALNQNRLQKAMVETEAQPFEDGDVCALAFQDPDAEANWIATTAGQIRGLAFDDAGIERGLSYSDIAILLRSVNANADPIVKALERAGVPFIIRGMNALFETPEATAARDLFLFLADPIADSQSLARIWREADLGVSDESVERAVEAAKKYRAALHSSEEREDRWALYNLQRQFTSFLEDLGLLEEVVPERRREIVFYNLGKFSQLISDFEAIHFHSRPAEKYKSFAEWLRFGADGSYAEGWQDNQYAHPDAVQIMTVHQAKGMQWPVVFLPALLRNRFPSAGIGGPSPWHIIPNGAVRDAARYKGGIEDERRLFYVAVTRSQKFLYMTWAPIPGKNNRYARPSEFWDSVIVSKRVKRRAPDYSNRRRLAPQAKTAVSNVVLSFSDLKYIFECPYQFKLRILYGFNAPLAEALGYGKSLHDVLAEVHANAINGHMPTLSEVDTLVARHLHVPYAYRALREHLEESAKKVVSAYIQDNADRFAQVEFAEKGIEINLGDGVSVIGRIDLVRKVETNEVTIVDLKSTERAQAENVTELQLHVYALGYEQLTGRDADYVEIYELDEGVQKARSVDSDFIEDVKHHVRSAAADLRTGSYERSGSTATCRKCDYRRMCSRGLEVEAQSAP